MQVKKGNVKAAMEPGETILCAGLLDMVDMKCQLKKEGIICERKKTLNRNEYRLIVKEVNGRTEQDTQP